MADIISLNAERIAVMDGADVFYGGNQEWFTARKDEYSGCGAVAVANMLYAQTDKKLSKPEYTMFMESVIQYISPAAFGIHSTAMMTQRLNDLISAKRLNLYAHEFHVPPRTAPRNNYRGFRAFLSGALKENALPSLLSLSSGKSRELHVWHWVNIMAFNTDTGRGVVCDNGRVISADLRRWYRTSLLGGGAVYLLPDHII